MEKRISFIDSSNKCANCHTNNITTLSGRSGEVRLCNECYRVVSNKSAQSRKSLDPALLQPIHCMEHPDEKYKYWCNTCDAIVCPECVILKHEGHRCVRMEQVISEKISEQQSWMRKMKAELDPLMEPIDTSERSLIDKITQTFSIVREVVNHHEHELKRKVRDIEKENTIVAENYDRKLKQKRDELNRWNEEFDRCRLTKDYARLLMSHKKLITEIKQSISELVRMPHPLRMQCRIKDIDKLQDHVIDIFRRVSVRKWQSVILKLPCDSKWECVGITVAGGSRTNDAGSQLACPTGIFIDNNDDESLFVADTYNHRIVQFKKNNTTGRVVAGGNQAGNRSSQLRYPTCVLVDSLSNSLIIADHGNRRVVQWSLRSSTTRGEVLIENISCFGLAMDEQRYLYVSDNEKHEVRRYAIEHGDKNGIVVAGGNGRGDGLHQLNEPNFIFVDHHRSVYVSDFNYHRITKWNKDATTGILVAANNPNEKSSRQFSHPHGIFVDGSGTLYVAESGQNQCITRWPDGAKEGTVIINGSDGNQFRGPRGLFLDKHGNIYVVDSNHNRVLRFARL